MRQDYDTPTRAARAYYTDHGEPENRRLQWQQRPPAQGPRPDADEAVTPPGPDVPSLNVRTDDDLQARIDKAASEMAMTRSDWVKMACENELRKHEPRGRRTIRVQRSHSIAGRVSSRFCSHPLELRSEAAKDGSTRCIACGETIRRLP